MTCDGNGVVGRCTCSGSPCGCTFSHCPGCERCAKESQLTAAEVEALAAALRKDDGMTLAEYPELPATLDAIAKTLRGYELSRKWLHHAQNCTAFKTESSVCNCGLDEAVP